MARERGVSKLMSVTDAKKKCPELVLVKGEDLTHYREMSYKVTGRRENQVFKGFMLCYLKNTRKSNIKPSKYDKIPPNVPTYKLESSLKTCHFDEGLTLNVSRMLPVTHI